MSDKLLYFPYIDIPKSNWTIKSILYWDEVGIIVPPAYAEEPSQYNQFTRSLLGTDLIKQIFPYNYTSKIPDFDNGFIKLINQPKFNLEQRQLDFQNNSWTKIHVQKFGDKLLNHLIQLEIAKRLDWQWFRVESRTAGLIMLYLASAIGIEDDYTPATDNIKNLDLTVSQRGLNLPLDKIRQNLLDDLIPYPIEPNLTELRRFKDRYYDELKDFRILIEGTAFDISLTSSSNQQTKHQHKIKEINERREKILSELNKSPLGEITFGTICGVTPPAFAVAVAAEQTALGMITLAGALYAAFKGYAKKEVLKRDYSYLALIDSKLKPKNY